MTSIQTARGVLADAEKALRELMQQEIQEHRYGDLGELARMADGVARLVRGQPESTPASALKTPAPGRAKPKTSRRSGSSRKEYPRFERDGSKLTKVGWSKKSREEYEHRAPRDAVSAFIEYLAAKVTPGSTFVMEDLMPVPDSSGGEIPSYQVYMTLAWLRHQGAVEKKGRDGYVLSDSTISGTGFSELWDQVPRKH